MANLQAILGPNYTYPEIERVINDITDLLIANEDISKD